MKSVALLKIGLYALLLGAELTPLACHAAPGNIAPKAASSAQPTQTPAAETTAVSNALLHKFITAVGRVTKIDYDRHARGIMGAHQRAALRQALREEKQMAQSAVTWISAAKSTSERASRLRETKQTLKPVRLEAFLNPQQKKALQQWYRQKKQSTVSQIMPYSQYHALDKRLDTDPKFYQRFLAAQAKAVSSQQPSLPWYAQVRLIHNAPPHCLRFSRKKIYKLQGTVFVRFHYSTPYVTVNGTPYPEIFLKLRPPLDVCHIPNYHVTSTPSNPTSIEALKNTKYKVTGVSYSNFVIPAVGVSGNWLGYVYQNWRIQTVIKLIDPYLTGRIQIWARLVGDTNFSVGWGVYNVLKACVVRHQALMRCQGHLPAKAPVVATTYPAAE